MKAKLSFWFHRGHDRQGLRGTIVALVLTMVVLPLVTVAAATAGTTVVGAVAAGPGTHGVSHWGSFFGNGTGDDTLLSPTVISLPGKVKQVATSNSTQYALLADGQVYAWGLGSDGELGDGSTADSYTVAQRVQFPTGVTIASLPTDAMPYDTGLAVDSTGQAWGWGLNPSSQLCLGKAGKELTPVKVPLTDVTALAGAGDHALYVSHGTVFACGSNEDGDLGDGSTASSAKAVQVAALAGKKVVAVVASGYDSGALLANGDYYDWGFNGQGQLGDGSLGVSSSVPVEVVLPRAVSQVVEGGGATDNGQTLVELSGGSFRAWGDNEYGQLGNGGTTTEASPVSFAAPKGVTYRQLATGSVTSYALSTTGVVYAWGGNGKGQIGNGGTRTQLTPLAVESGIAGISSTAQDVASGP